MNYMLDYWDYASVRPDTFSAWIDYSRGFDGQYKKGDDPEWEAAHSYKRRLTINFNHASPEWQGVLDFNEEKARDPFFRDCVGAGLIPVRCPVTVEGYRLVAHIQDKELLKRHIETLGMQGKDAHWIRLDNNGLWSEKYGDGAIQPFKGDKGEDIVLPHIELSKDNEHQKYVFVQYYLTPVNIHRTRPVSLPFEKKPVILTPQN